MTDLIVARRDVSLSPELSSEQLEVRVAHDITVACCAGLGLSALSVVGLGLGFKFGILHIGPWYQYAALAFRVVPLALVLVGSFAAYHAHGPKFPRRLFVLSSGMMLAWYALGAIGLDNLVARVLFGGALLLGSASWLTTRKKLIALEATSAKSLGVKQLPDPEVGAV